MMWKVRYYVPLIGFVVPTLVIGYGFVIPCSCIAGVNELSIGFGSTVLGAVFAYLGGIRAATVTACPVRVPWRTRLARYVNRQASHPEGLFGRLLGVIWTFEHRRINERTLELLAIAPTDRVLEIGSGPGLGLQRAALRAPLGRVTGLDVSATMIAAALRRNHAAVRAGQVDVSLVDGRDLELPAATYDRAFSIHCLYFWSDPVRVLCQIAVSLRPGGRFVLTLRPDSADLPARYRDAIYRFYSVSEIERMLSVAGFGAVRVVNDARGPLVSIVAERWNAPVMSAGESP
jgi:SAM-dependent methyltransferase